MRILILLVLLTPHLVSAQANNDLSVYDYYLIHQNNEPQCGFVVLSDGFPYNDFKEKNIIAPENLGEFEYSNDNYHELRSVYRERFLSGLKIKETDFLFVNNLNKNKINSFKVKDLKLTAF
jgi:hypothetical protein